MSAIKKYKANITVVEKKLVNEEVTFFAPEGLAKDQLENLAEATLLNGFTENYKETIELTETKVMEVRE